MIDAPAIESTYWAALNHTRAAGLRAWMSAATLATASNDASRQGAAVEQHRERERRRQRQLSLGAAPEDADPHELAEQRECREATEGDVDALDERVALEQDQQPERREARE